MDISGFRDSSAILFIKGTTKRNFEKPQKFNEFSKLGTKSCMSRTMNNLKDSFYNHESDNNKNNNFENDDFVSRYACVRYVV